MSCVTSRVYFCPINVQRLTMDSYILSSWTLLQQLSACWLSNDWTFDTKTCHFSSTHMTCNADINMLTAVWSCVNTDKSSNTTDHSNTTHIGTVNGIKQPQNAKLNKQRLSVPVTSALQLLKHFKLSVYPDANGTRTARTAEQTNSYLNCTVCHHTQRGTVLTTPHSSQWQLTIPTFHDIETR